MSRLTSRRSVSALLSATFAATVGISSFVSADPLPNEELKFYQSPLNDAPPGVYPVGAVPQPGDAPAPFPGMDVTSTAITTASGGAQGNMVADDFSDNNPLPIGHVTWWGSYLEGTGSIPVTQFQISLYTNVPAIAGTNQDFSEPGSLIATQVVSLGALSYSSGTFTANPVPLGTGGAAPVPGESGLIEYNAELDWQKILFPDATNGNVEWLSIVALLPVNSAPITEWGWHDRDWGISDPYAPAGDETAAPPYHFLDDAVSGSYNGSPSTVGGFAPANYNPQYDGISGSMDMAFALYTVPTSVPEPATIGLLALTIPALLARRRRKSTC